MTLTGSIPRGVTNVGLVVWPLGAPKPLLPHPAIDHRNPLYQQRGIIGVAVSLRSSL